MKVEGYDFSQLIHDVKARGLVMDWGALERAIPVFHSIDITQRQADVLMRLHTDEVVRAWDRRNYTLRDRFFVALYWLGLTPNPFA